MIAAFSIFLVHWIRLLGSDHFGYLLWRKSNIEPSHRRIVRAHDARAATHGKCRSAQALEIVLAILMAILGVYQSCFFDHSYLQIRARLLAFKI